jgi:hypothetical protein
MEERTTALDTKHSFVQASKFVITFGKHKGKTIGQIARTDKGLCWLDWLRGQREEQRLQHEKLGKPFKPYPSDVAVDVYMHNPTIQKELDAVIRLGAMKGTNASS